MSKNYYDILGVKKDTSIEDIKKAYKKLAVKHHPDKNQGDKQSEEKFKEINEAYQILSDPNKKSNYDLGGNGGFGGNGRSYGNADDINAQFERFRQQAQADFNNFGRTGRGGIRKGQSIQVIVELTLEEIYHGIKKTIKYKKDKNCDHCSGNGSKEGSHLQMCNVCGGAGRVVLQHGHFHIENTCHNCGGYGKIILEECDYCSGAGVEKKDVELQVEIPAGVKDGWNTMVPNFGNDAFMSENGIPGDLYLVITQIMHDKFEREGDNLIYRLEVEFPQAALGGKVESPTIDGKSVSFELSECTPNGKLFRLKERGMPSFVRKGTFGDMIVLIDVKMPTSLTDKEKDLLEKLLKEKNFKTK